MLAILISVAIEAAMLEDSMASHENALKALVNIVVDRFKKIRTVLANLYNYVQVDE